MSGAELVGLYKQVANSSNLIGLEAVFKAGFQEFTRLRQDVKSDPDAVMGGVHRAMRVARAKEEERLEAHLPFLATVGSISPYIGLFGTVWGIMNSFRGLAASSKQPWQRWRLVFLKPWLRQRLVYLPLFRR